MDNIENTSVETENQDLSQEEENMEAEHMEAAGAETPATGEKKEKGPAAHLAFVAAAKAHAEALGLQTKDQKGFFQIWNATTGHKLYVAKQGRAVTRIDTTLPVEELGAISLPLTKPNGRVTCHVQATPEAVSAALDVLASYGEKIPSPKRPAKAAETTPAE